LRSGSDLRQRRPRPPRGPGGGLRGAAGASGSLPHSDTPLRKRSHQASRGEKAGAMGFTVHLLLELLEDEQQALGTDQVLVRKPVVLNELAAERWVLACAPPEHTAVSQPSTVAAAIQQGSRGPGNGLPSTSTAWTPPSGSLSSLKHSRTWQRSPARKDVSKRPVLSGDERRAVRTAAS